jgi:hypothetical protein
MPSIDLQIERQPTDSTCGPTCLHALYGYYGDSLPLDQIIGEVSKVDHGGTLAVMLALHALRRGYSARIYTYNLEVFDPSWLLPSPTGGKRPDLAERLRAQIEVKRDPKLVRASRAYIDYLELGGDIRMRDLSRNLLRDSLKAGTPILTGLSATWLYRSAREMDDPMRDDDLRGLAQGHFVVLSGYDKDRRTVSVADPLQKNPVSSSQYYDVDIDRLVTSILLGTYTSDANLLLLRPGKSREDTPRVDPDRRRKP